MRTQNFSAWISTRLGWRGRTLRCLKCLTQVVWLLLGAGIPLFAQPTITDFKIQRPGGVNYTTGVLLATASEVPLNAFTIQLTFSESVRPVMGANAQFDRLPEITDLLVLQSGSSSGTGPDLLTEASLASSVTAATHLRHTLGGQVIRFDLSLASNLLPGETYTLSLDTNQVVATTDTTQKAKPFSMEFSTAKAITVLPAMPGSAAATTICNRGRPQVLPPMAIHEQSAGTFAVGSGRLVLGFDHPDIKITQVPTVALIGAPGDFALPVVSLTPSGQLELTYNFTGFEETSGILLTGLAVASMGTSSISGAQLRPISGFEHFTGMDSSTVLATIHTVNLTSTGGPVRPNRIDGPRVVCRGGSHFTYVAAPVAGVTGYHWKLPTGLTTTDPDATLIPASGPGAYHTPDNQITLAVATTTATTGSYALEVKAANDCRVSAFARTKMITVAPAPNPVVSLPATRFSLKATTPVPITVTNFPAGGIGTLSGDGVLGDKLYPSLLAAGKSYKVYYDYTVNNCMATAEFAFEVYDPDAVILGLQAAYCSDDPTPHTIQVDGLASSDSLKLFGPSGTEVALSSRLLGGNTYAYIFTPSTTLFAAHGPGTYRFEVAQITSSPRLKTIVTFELRQPPRQTVQGPATVCGDGTRVYNYASSVPATGSDRFHWEVLAPGSGTMVGGIDDGPQVSVIWNGGSATGTMTTLRLTQTREGCETITNYPITIFEAPNPNIQGKAVVCSGETATYTLDNPPGGSGSTYLWQVKNGKGGTIVGPTNGATVIVRWEKTGVLEVIQTKSGCASSGSHPVAVETLPNITITGLNATATYCAGDGTPVKLTPIFDGLMTPPADYLTAGRFEIKRISGNKPATTGYIRLTDQFIPAHPVPSPVEAATHPTASTRLINLNVGVYKIRYLYHDPAKRCPNYSPEYEIEIKALPVLTFTGLAKDGYCGNDSPVVLSSFKNGVFAPVLPGFQVKQLATGIITTLNGTVLEPAKLPAGDYELYLELGGEAGAGTGTCGNTSQRDTSVYFTVTAPPARLRVSATRDFNETSIRFTLDTTGLGPGIQPSWNFGNLLASTTQVDYPVAPDGQGRIASTNYTLMVQNTASCATTITQNFVVDFTLEGHCLGMPTRFHDASRITGAGISRWQWNFGDGNTSNNQHPTHVYAQPGTYWVSLTVGSSLAGGHQANYTLRRRVDIFPVVKVSKQSPYQENFETASGSHHWISHGVVDSAGGKQLDQSSWQLQNGAWATTANQATGVNADAGATYFASEQSYLESPCFDLAALPRPMVSFRYTLDTDPGGDGVVMLYTVDDGQTWHRLGKQGEGIHWYNRKPILGRPGERYIKNDSNADQQGWSGREKNQSNGGAWLTARLHLEEVLQKMNALGVTSQNKRVRFRFAFGSNADNPPGSSRLKGFALDDFEIRSRNRGVLVEYFINESIPGAAEKDQAAANFAKAHPEAISLHYHTDFPGADRFNAANDKDPGGRTFYYGMREVPRLIIDGKGRDSLPDDAQAAQTYLRHTLLPAPFELAIQSPKLTEQNTLAVTTRIKSLAPFNRPVVIQVVLVDTLAHSGSNTGNRYQHVVRKMLPDAAGTFVEAKSWPPGDSLVMHLDWDFANYPVPLNLSRLQVVAFVQDYHTKEIYQATRYTQALPQRTDEPDKITGLPQKVTASRRALTIFPNPATGDRATVLLPTALQKVPLHQIRWEIADTQGRTVQRGHWASRTSRHIVYLDEIPSGTYLFRLYFQGQVFQGKLLKER